MSLIELVIVMAILMVLLILSIQFIGGFRNYSKDTQCATHLRQLSAATLLMVQDYNNTLQSFMGGGHSRRMWAKMLLAGGYLGNDAFSDMDSAKQLAPAVKESGHYLRCPIGQIDSPKYDEFTDPKAWVWQTYGMAMYDSEAYIELGESSTRIFVKPLAAIVNPSRYILLADSSGGGGNHFQSFRISNRYGSKSGLALRHKGKAYVSFADGHVELIDRRTALEYGVPQEIIYEVPQVN